MKKWGIIRLISMILIAAAGCSSQPQVSVRTVESSRTSAVQETVIAETTPVPVFTTKPPIIEETNSPTATLIQSPQPSLTATRQLENNIQYITLTSLPEIPQETKINGAFVMVYPYWSGNRQIELIDIAKGTSKTLIREGLATYIVIVSPDHKWMAYTEAPGQFGVDTISNSDGQTALHQEPTLVIVGADGRENTRIPYQPGWGALSRWLPDNRLIIRRWPTTSWYSSYTAKLVLNPFKGTQVELPPDPPDIYNLYPVFDWSGIGMVSYNPTLTQRIYANNESLTIFEDMVTHERVRFFSPLDSAREWSPDGKSVIMAGLTQEDDISQADYELIRVNDQGEIQALTNLNDNGIGLYPANYTWSPDSQKIAFWVYVPEQQDYNHVNPAVLDIDTGMITIFTLESRRNGLPTLVWSPDGRQILMGFNSPEGEKAVLVDLIGQWSVQVADGKMPVGWLNR